MAVGMAAALAVCQPHDAAGVVIAMVGGAVGADICDIDAGGRPGARGRRVALVVAVAAAVAWDTLVGQGVVARALGPAGPGAIAGVVLFGAVCAAGVLGKHRGLMHSVAALAASAAGVWLVWPPLAIGYGVGFASHIALDVLNYQGVQVLWPLPWRVSLGVAKADGVVNMVLGAVGIAVTAVLAWGVVAPG